LRPEFAKYRGQSLSRREYPELKRILISMGGVDKDNVTGRVLKALAFCRLSLEVEVEVILGRVSPHVDALTAQAAAMPWATQVHVDVPDMAKRMAESDIAIGAAGSTSWERCCLGLPTIQVVLADNQKKIGEALHSMGALLDSCSEESIKTCIPRVLESVLLDMDLLRTHSRMCSKITDGQGVFTVAQILISDL
jgi:spore coat polysaccharide biosynthesis predicted glycosyltransferase SpsG